MLMSDDEPSKALVIRVCFRPASKKRMRQIARIFAASVLLLLFFTGYGQADKIDVNQWPQQSERSRTYDALHYRVNILLDIAAKSFKGEATITISPLNNDFRQCVLDAEEFTVTSVTDKWAKPLTFKQGQKKLTVQMTRAYRYGEIISFTVYYFGEKPIRGLRFYDKSPDNPPLVASDSWPDNVHHWFPCYDYPNDKVTNEIIATVKQGFKVLSNGRLAEVRHDKTKGMVTYHWRQEQLHSTYLIFLAAAPYEVVRDAYKNIPIHYWVYPKDKPFARITFKNTPKMMEYFNRIFGYDYPWAKYDQVVVPFGGGMECTSATAMGQWIVHDERGAIDFFNTGIVAHELAHQWWGDLITLRTWAHTWLNEGFGTYCDYLYYRYEYGDDEGAVNLLGKKDRYLGAARTRYIRPIVMDRYRMPQDMFDAHTYPKAALVIHMLRSILGDDAFFRTLKHFLHEHAFQPVDTHDFIKAVKTVSGQNLDWFFQQWLYSPGHPVLNVNWKWSEKNRQVLLTVKQIQDRSKGVPLFRLPVVVGVYTASGKEIHRLEIQKEQEEFQFNSNEKPLMVRFDEGNCLLKEWTFKKSKQELLYQLAHDDVIGRMWAAGQLLRFKDDPAVSDALVKRVASDSFWSVRKKALRILAKINSAAHVTLFKEKCLDSHSKVRTEALNILANLKMKSLAGFFKDRFKKDVSYLAKAQALSALGMCGDKSSIPLLKEAEKMYSPRFVIRNAAKEALENLR